MSQELEKQLSLLDGLQAACTHCGLCSEVCSTFHTSGWEHESPRGRIRLARDLMDGKIEPSSSSLSTFDRCLGCHACEVLCPISVQYGNIRQVVQQLRSDLVPSKKEVSSQKLYRQWIRAAYRVGSLFWRHYGQKWITIDFLPLKRQRSYLKKKGQNLPASNDLTLVVGCVQDIYNHDVIEKAMQVLTWLGYRVHLAKSQPCCGAILNRLVHGGQEAVHCPIEYQEAKSYQEHRAINFFKWLPREAYFLSMGCQCYTYQRTQPGKEKNLYQLILETLHQKGLKLVLSEPQIVYYQPYCGQKKKFESDPIWLLLTKIEGLTVKLFPYPYGCCGGYNGEYLFHPQQAKEILQFKLHQIPKNSTVIVASMDCHGQFLSHATAHSLKIAYPIQLIAELISKKH